MVRPPNAGVNLATFKVRAGLYLSRSDLKQGDTVTPESAGLKVPEVS